MFADFELELEWRANATGVGTLAIRQSEAVASCDAPAITLRAYTEVTPALELAGGLLGVQPPTLAMARPLGEYNRTRIVARGSSVQHWLNGRKVLSFDSAGHHGDTHSAGTPPSAHTGKIIVQDCGAQLQLRYVRIRPL